MSAETEQSPLEKIIEAMTRHSVELIVIGGQAEWIFGSPRLTYDVDLCYRRTPQNLERLARALRELRPTLRDAPEIYLFESMRNHLDWGATSH